MPKTCTICAHPDRQAMEDALFRNRTPFRNVSKQYGVTVSALFRHKEHVSQRLVRTVADVTGSLSPKKRRYVEERLSGKSRRASALSAGYSESMANHPDKVETQNVREAFAALIRETVPPERIAQVIMEGMGANDTKFFAHEGRVQDSREVIAWSERRQYAELAAEYGGYYMQEKNDGKPGGGVILILPDSPKVAAVSGATLVAAQPSESGPTLLLPSDPGPGADA
jgi:hypothetical protein